MKQVKLQRMKAKATDK